jgi:halocyanin-like protein
MSDYNRRTVVRGLGALTVAGALAGCSGGGGNSTPESGGNGGGDTTESGGNGGDTTESGGNGGDTTESGGGSMAVPSAVSDYLSDTSNFDGSLADMTGQDSVTVEVGASGNNGNFAYAPPAIAVDSGTTVTWEWTGQGSQHNVVAESGGDFESELTAESGFTFEQTFDSTGAVTYYCTPHEALGMKGAVVVR